MGFMSANGLFWKSVDRYIDKCKVGRSTLMPYIKNIFKRKFLMHICFIFIDNFISPHKCSKYSVPLMEWLLQEHQPCQCQDRKSSFVISGRQQASPSQGSSCLSPLPAPPPPAPRMEMQELSLAGSGGVPMHWPCHWNWSSVLFYWRYHGLIRSVTSFRRTLPRWMQNKA